MDHVIHEQVEKQLQYLKAWVDSEVKHKEDCKKWGIRYTPSRRKWEDIDLYQDYKAEIEKNGDKNLLVMVKMWGDGMYGTYPFARRYVYQPYLVYRNEYGGEVLVREDEVEVVR